MKACDALVLPNKKGDAISEKFTSPMKLFEYMASGVPIIASDLPSIREVLDENSAIFFEAGNSKDLHSAIQKLFSAPSRTREKLSLRAVSLSREYDWKKRGEKIAVFLKEHSVLA